MPKIAIYAICKNESKFVERFYEYCKEADYVVVADTGSTDDTKDKLKKLPNTIVGDIVIDPWRFDYARNASLELVPNNTDIYICLDLDEILKPGWRKKLEDAYTPDKTRFRYKYTWNWKADGTPDVQYNGDKIHCKGYHWHHPVHEILRWDGNGSEEVYGWSDLEIEHYADNTKPRSHYLGLLELAVKEDQEDDRNAHYLGREYFFVGRYLEAINELKRHLSLPRTQWDAERAASMRYIADSYNYLKDQKQRIAWALRAVAEAPTHREPWVNLAQAYYDNKDYLGGYYAAKHALDIKDRQNSYLTSGDAWGALPYDLAGTCAYYVGLQLEAYELTLRAYRIDPNNTRIQCNVKFMEEYIRDNLGQNATDVIEHTRKVIIVE